MSTWPIPRAKIYFPPKLFMAMTNESKKRREKIIELGFGDDLFEVPDGRPPYFDSRNYKLSRFLLTYSLEYGPIDKSALLLFLKNRAVVMNCSVKFWVIFQAKLEDCPVLYVLLWLDSGVYRGFLSLSDQFTYQNTRPFVNTMGSRIWNNCLIMKPVMTNLNLREYFQERRGESCHDWPHGFGLRDSSVIKQLLRNFRGDLQVLDFEPIVERDSKVVEQIREIVAARLLSDNRVNRDRADVRDKPMLKRIESLLAIHRFKFDVTDVRQQTEELRSLEKMIASQSLKLEQLREKIREAESTRRTIKNEIAEAKRTLESSVTGKRKPRKTEAQDDDKDEPEKDSGGWFSSLF